MLGFNVVFSFCFDFEHCNIELLVNIVQLIAQSEFTGLACD